MSSLTCHYCHYVSPLYGKEQSRTSTGTSTSTDFLDPNPRLLFHYAYRKFESCGGSRFTIFVIGKNWRLQTLSLRTKYPGTVLCCACSVLTLALGALDRNLNLETIQSCWFNNSFLISDNLNCQQTKFLHCGLCTYS